MLSIRAPSIRRRTAGLSGGRLWRRLPVAAETPRQGFCRDCVQDDIGGVCQRQCVYCQDSHRVADRGCPGTRRLIREHGLFCGDPSPALAPWVRVVEWVPAQINENENGGKKTTDIELCNVSVQTDELVDEKDSAMDTDQVQVTSEIGRACGANVTEDAATNSATNFAKQSRRSKRLYELLQMELVEDMHAGEAQSVFCAESIRGESSGRTEGADSLRESEGVSVDNSKDLKHRHTDSFSSLAHRQIRRSLIGSKLRKMYRKQKTSRKKLFPWNYDWHREQEEVDEQLFNSSVVIRRCKSGPVDHGAVLRAMTQALATTEEAYMELVESSLDRNPELALMGSCVLVMLMKDQDVYVMNLGDSRVILAQDRLNDRHISSTAKDDARNQNRSRESLVRVELDRISEESPMHNPNSRVCSINKNREISLCRLKMEAVQLSTDHSTSIAEEISRIKAEHDDDVQAVLNDRVKGQLKVTRAFGAGFLKKYFSNEEVVSHVAWFIENVPEGDPAQYLIAELLLRAAKKMGWIFLNYWIFLMVIAESTMMMFL